MDFSNMNVEHLSQVRLFGKAIAYEIKPDARAKGASSAQEVLVGLRF
ncbi:MAG: hypothetical protein ACYDDS_11325 [Candidatus Sulfotelmatobacter sp.]